MHCKALRCTCLWARNTGGRLTCISMDSKTATPRAVPRAVAIKSALVLAGHVSQTPGIRAAPSDIPPRTISISCYKIICAAIFARSRLSCMHGHNGAIIQGFVSSIQTRQTDAKNTDKSFRVKRATVEEGFAGFSPNSACVPSPQYKSSRLKGLQRSLGVEQATGLDDGCRVQLIARLLLTCYCTVALTAAFTIHSLKLAHTM
jgi:hypothetical protein